MRGGQVRGLWAPQARALTAGLVLTITFVASEALAVVTVMPVVARDLGGFRLYGWVFSAFMLGSVVGIVAAGREADRRGPAIPFVAGLVLFEAGLTVAGFAPSMAVLVAGRVLQGMGAGAVPAVAYASIGRSLAGPLRARMMAVLSTAWVAPGLVGPALAAEVAHVFGWRWVFLGLLPLVAITGSVAVPALIRLGPPVSRGEAGHRLTDGITVAAGAAMILAGLTLAAGSGAVLAAAALAGVGLIAAGLAVGLPALRRLVPAGTVGGRIAGTHRPSASSAADASRARCSVPRMTGMIGLEGWSGRAAAPNWSVPPTRLTRSARRRTSVSPSDERSTPSAASAAAASAGDSPVVKM